MMKKITLLSFCMVLSLQAAKDFDHYRGGYALGVLWAAERKKVIGTWKDILIRKYSEQFADGFAHGYFITKVAEFQEREEEKRRPTRSRPFLIKQ